MNITDFNKSKRFTNDNYKRPKKTIQDKLTPEEIEEKLEDYIEVDNIQDVSLNTHLRYFSIITDKKKTKKVFRLGGFLINKNNYENFVVLSNGTNRWSVQTKKSIFYRKQTLKEIKENYEEKIEELSDKVKKLKKELRKYKDLIKNKSSKKI